MYKRQKYGDVDVAFSTPRIRPHAGVFEDVFAVSYTHLDVYKRQIFNFVYAMLT